MMLGKTIGPAYPAAVQQVPVERLTCLNKAAGATLQAERKLRMLQNFRRHGSCQASISANPQPTVRITRRRLADLRVGIRR